MESQIINHSGFMGGTQQCTTLSRMPCSSTRVFAFMKALHWGSVCEVMRESGKQKKCYKRHVSQWCAVAVLEQVLPGIRSVNTNCVLRSGVVLWMQLNSIEISQKTFCCDIFFCPSSFSSGTTNRFTVELINLRYTPSTVLFLWFLMV